MTLPSERTRAVIEVERRILSLTSHASGKSPCAMVPRWLLRLLIDALRHYPTGHDLSESARKAPEIWGEPNE